MNLAIPTHPLQRFRMNTEKLRRFIAIQKGLETNSGLGRDWLGEGANLCGWEADIVDS